MSRSVRNHLLIVAAGVLVFFTNLGGPKLWDDDEPRNATCAREMLARGDWVVPMFNGELRTDKPVLLYWLIMGAYRVFGENEFAARFWSAISAVGTVICTYHLGRLLFRPQVGVWAALSLTTALWFGFTGRAATPDSLLIFLSTFALLWFVKSSFHRTAVPNARANTSWKLGASSQAIGPGVAALSPLAEIEPALRPANTLRDLLPRRWIDFAIIYTAMALAVLAKGPIGVLLPGGIMAFYLLWMLDGSTHAAPAPRSWWGLYDSGFIFLRRLLLPPNVFRVLWGMRPLTGMLIVATVAAPWYIAVGVRTEGAWLTGFLMNHNLHRFSGSLNGHGGTVFYYVPTILAGFFPWSIFLPLSLWRPAQRVYAHDPQRRVYAFLFAWLLLYVGFFTLAGTKLPSYVLPAYPALAVLVGAFLERWFARPGTERKFWMRAAFISLAAVGAAGLVGLPWACSKFLPGERLIGLPGLIPLVGGMTALVLLELRQFRRAILATAATSVVLSTVLFGFVALRISSFQNSERFAKAARQFSGEDVKMATYQIFPSSLVFYAGQPVEYLEQSPQLGDFFKRWPNGCLFLSYHAYCANKDILPADVVFVDRQQWFLRPEDVLLISRPPTVAHKPDIVDHARMLHR